MAGGADACGCTACVRSGVMCRAGARYFTERWNLKILRLICKKAVDFCKMEG